MIIFTPNTVIKSADVNADMAGLADGTLIEDNAIKANNVDSTIMAMTRTSTSAIANTTWTAFNMNVAQVDKASAAYWSTADHNKLNFPTDGVYAVDMHCAWQNSGAGTLRALLLEFNGTTTVGSGTDYRSKSEYRAPVPFNNKNMLHLEFWADAGDYAYMYCYQNSGGSLNVEYAANYNTSTQVNVRKVSN